MGEHISTLHATCKAVIAAELTDKIRCALCKQTQNTHEFYEINEMFTIKETATLNGKVLQKLLGKMAQLFFYAIVVLL